MAHRPWHRLVWHDVAQLSPPWHRSAPRGTVWHSRAQLGAAHEQAWRAGAWHSSAQFGLARLSSQPVLDIEGRTPPRPTRCHPLPRLGGVGDATPSGPRPVPRDVTPRPPGSSDSSPLDQNGRASSSELSPRHWDSGHPTLPDVPAVPAPLLAVPTPYPSLPSPSHHVKHTLGKEMSCQGGRSVTGLGDGVPHKAVPQVTTQVTQLSLVTAQVPPGCVLCCWALGPYIHIHFGDPPPPPPPHLGSGTPPHLPAGETEAPSPCEPLRLGRAVVSPPDALLQPDPSVGCRELGALGCGSQGLLPL